MEKEEKKEPSTVVKKNKKVEVETKKGGKYSYTYTDLASINLYVEELGEKYYQFIERIDNDDYIMTVRQKDGKDSQPIRGCRVIQATLDTVNNPAQEQGSALTYARRYSLSMAYGLATEDDDANALTRAKIETKEDAENFIITFGKKHNGETLKEILEKDAGYIEWLLNGEKTDKTIKDAIILLKSDDKTTKEEFLDQMDEDGEMINEGQKQNIMSSLSKTSLDGILKKTKVETIDDLTYKQAYEIERMIRDKQNKKLKEEEEVF